MRSIFESRLSMLKRDLEEAKNRLVSYEAHVDTMLAKLKEHPGGAPEWASFPLPKDPEQILADAQRIARRAAQLDILLQVGYEQQNQG